MALLTPQSPAIGGIVPTYSAVASEDTFTQRERQFLIVKNGGGSTDNVTVVVPGSTRGIANPDITVAVAAGTEKWFGPFDAGLTDPTDQLIHVLHSFTTSVTCALVTTP